MNYLAKAKNDTILNDRVEFSMIIGVSFRLKRWAFRRYKEYLRGLGKYYNGKVTGIVIDSTDTKLILRNAKFISDIKDKDFSHFEVRLKDIKRNSLNIESLYVPSNRYTQYIA